MTYPRKSFLRLSRFGKDKMAYLRAKILIGAVQPNPISVVSQRISRVISVWINECFLCITGQQGVLGPGKGINYHHKCRFSSPSHCVYVQTFFSHPVLLQFEYKHRILAWKILLLAAANDVPLPPFAHNCPSFLTPCSDALAAEPWVKHGECVA